MLQDLRIAARTLWKSPRFAATAAVALALGIGANTAIFSVVEAVLLRPLPYRNPDRLVVVLNTSVRQGDRIPVAPADFSDWREQNRVFESLAAAEAWSVSLTGTDRPEEVEALHVSTNLFELLGVKPVLGRTFLPEEETPGNHRAVVISYRLWQRRFGGDAGVIGRRVRLNGEEYTIDGVMPPEFRFAPFWQTKAELWAPLALTSAQKHSRDGSSLRIFARLRQGVTVAGARAEMQMIARRLELEYPRTNTGRGVSVTALQEMTAGDARPALLVLQGAVAFILLIACANVANLLLTRAAGRRREMALRLAVGASRWRLLRQSLTESLLLALAGGAAGLVLAWWGVHALVSATPDVARFGLPGQQELGLNAAVLLFTILLSLLTGLIFGVVPALQASATDLNEVLKEGGRGPASAAGRGLLRSSLVVSEIALALMLLAGAGLMVRSFQKLRGIDPGFRPQGVLTMAVSVAGSQHAGVAGRSVFYHQLVAQVEAMPGVEAASAINHLPLAGDVWTLSFRVEGRPAPEPGSEPKAVYRVALPNYFSTMGIALVSGRDFSEHDNSQTPGVVIVNETLAGRYWPNESPIGRRMKLGDPGDPWLAVIGIARDAKQHDWTEPPFAEMYLPYYQIANPQSYTTLVIRTRPGLSNASSALQSAIWTLDKDLPISASAGMEQVVANSTWQPRFSMSLLGAFAGVALVLAALGIYGVISYTVSQRTHEIGVRMALGARPADVLWMVVRQGAVLALAGLLSGAAGALAVTRSLSSLLYHVSAADPLTFFIISLLLAVVALVASYIPARRATRISPISALRHE